MPKPKPKPTLKPATKLSYRPKHFAVLVRRRRDAIWKFYRTNSINDAEDKGNGIDGALGIIKIEELTKDQYDNAIASIANGKSPIAPLNG